MAFDPITSPIDTIELDGKKSPGLADIVGASSLREWIERGGYALTGGFSVFKKRKLAHFSVRIRLYTAQDWADWHAWRPLVDRIPTKRGGQQPASGYLRIAHPILEDLDIKACGVEKVSQPEQTADGEWTITIDFIEFRSPKLTLATPEATKPVPIDPVEQEIKDLSGQNQALNDRLAAP